MDIQLLVCRMKIKQYRNEIKHYRNGEGEESLIIITYALSVLWNFTAEPKNLDMPFLTVFEVLLVVGFPFGAEGERETTKTMAHNDRSHLIK